MNIVTETEIARLWTAYGEEIEAAEESERPWWGLARTLTFVALGTALRRGELLGACWHDVSLLEGRWAVRQTFVRGKVHGAQERSLSPHDRTRAQDGRATARPLASIRLQGRRRDRLLSPDQGDAARPEQDRHLHANGDQAGRDHEARRPPVNSRRDGLRVQPGRCD